MITPDVGWQLTAIGSLLAYGLLGLAARALIAKWERKGSGR